MKRLLDSALRRVLPFFLAGGSACLLATGGPGGAPAARIAEAAVVLLLCAQLLYDSLRRRDPGGPEAALRELRVLLSAASLLMLGVSLSPAGADLLAPLVFLLALFAGTFCGRLSVGSVAAWLVALRWIEGGGPRGAGDALRAAVFTLFVIAFAAFGVVFLRAQAARVKRSGVESLERYFSSMIETARSFRFISMASADAGGEKEDRKVRILTVHAALEETRSVIYTLAETLRQGFDLHSCVVLWLTASGEHFKVIEASSLSEGLERGDIPARFGLTGAALRHRRTLSLCPHDPAGGNVIPYYSGPQEVRSVLIVPAMEGGEVRGLVCADRLAERPFTPQEEKVFELAAAQAVRVVGTERTILHMARSKHEQGKLYRAASRLKDAVKEEQVLDVLLESARDIARWDAAAFTTYDAGEDRHRVALARGRGAEELAGLSFARNEGLVAQAVKMRQPLPWKGEYDPDTQIVFSRRLKLRSVRSLYVVPATAGEKTLGTLVLMAEREGAFSAEKRKLLHVVVDQAAIAYANALAVRQLEQLATTDPLTGLANKRVLMETLRTRYESARRFGKSLSLVMTDLDRFKSINDTHGHPAGDRVLVAFADVLRQNARQVDLVARYGGEEFVVLCEETDREGAVHVAERIRADLEEREIRLDAAEAVRVTCSLGAATFPHDAASPEALLEKADALLYIAKRTGRNRVVSSLRQDVRKAG